MDCPHCQHPLPEPPERFCPNCGGLIEAAAAPPPPIPQSPPEAARRATPWERRGPLGLAPAAVETTRQVLFGPGSFFASMPVSGGIGDPLGYGMLVGSLGVIVAALYQALFRVMLGSTLAGFGDRGPLARILPMLEGGVGLIFQVVLGPIFVLIGMFVLSALYHLFLMMLGGARRDFEATFRVVAYCQAASAFLLIPFCGNFVAAVWGLVIAIIGLAEAHEIGKGTAAAAVLLPFVLICCCCGLGLGMIFGGIASFWNR
jgi:hypothetical protein